MKKSLYILGLIALIPTTVWAINITVPAAPGANYVLLSTTTGAYRAVATSSLGISGGASLSGGSPNTLTYWTSDTTVGATSSPTVGYITATSTTATSTIAGGLTVGTNKLVVNNFNGNVGIGTTTPYAKMSIQSTSNDSTPLFAIASSTNGTGTTTAFYVGANGRVGIGMENPVTALQLNNSPELRLSRDAVSVPNQYFSLIENPTGASFVGMSDQTNQKPLIFTANESTLYQPTATLALKFQVNNETALNIDYLKRIGVGTTSPRSLLDVVGTRGSQTDLFNVSSTTATDVVSSLFRIQANGNVGIGTTSPGALLDVYTEVTGATSTLRLSRGSLSGSGDAIGALQFYESKYGGGVEAQISGYRGNSQLYGGLTFWTSNNNNLLERMRIDNLGNVGIGTTSPAMKLDVVGAGRFTEGTLRSSAMLSTGTIGGVGGVLYLANDVGSTLGATRFITTYSGAGTIGYSNLAIQRSTNSIAYGGDPSTLTYVTSMTIDGSTGNVGIGTTTPRYKTEVVGGSATPFGVTSNNTNTAYLDINTLNSTTYSKTLSLGVENGNATPYGFIQTSGGSFFNLVLNRYGGNVGIGTMAPAQKLDMVAGGAYGYNGQILAQASTTLFNYFFGNSGNLTATGDTNTAVGNTSLHSLGAGGKNVAIGGGTLYSGVTNGYDTAVGYTAGYYHTGGFDTAIGASSLFHNTTSGNNTAVGYQSGYTLLSGANNTFIGYGADVTSAASTTLTNSTAIGYNSIVGCSNCLVLGGTGANAVNVGIGTTSPWAALSIQETVGGSTPLFIVASSTAGTGTTTAMFIDSYGRVGVGTTTLAAPFTVTGSGTGIVQTGQWVGGNNYAGYYMNGDFATVANNFNFLSSPTDKNLYINRPSAADIIFREANGATPNMILKATTGNVGIGTTSPLDQLHVFKTASDHTMAVDSAGQYTTIDFMHSGVQKGQMYYDNSNSFFAFAAANSIPFYINPAGANGNVILATGGGNVGIGTTTPGSMLSVAGNGNIIPPVTVTGAQSPISLNGTYYYAGIYNGQYYYTGSNGGFIWWLPIGYWIVSPVLGMQVNDFYQGGIGNGQAPLTAGWTPQIGATGTLTTAASTAAVAVSGNGYLSGSLGIGGGLTIFGASNFIAATTTYNTSTNIFNVTTASSTNSILSILGNGNVGIGTSTPTAYLDVNGNALFGQNITQATATPENVSLGGSYGNNTPGSAANTKLSLFNDGAGNIYGLGVSSGLMEFRTPANASFGFFPNNSTTQALSINSGGNVGIGSTTPWGQLSASSTSAFPTFAVQQNSTGPAATFLGGNVGIGMVSPVSKVEVTTNDSGKFLQLDYLGSPLNYNLNVVDAVTANNVAWNFTQRNNGTDYNVLSFNGGKVGIGTTTPDAALTVTSPASVYTSEVGNLKINVNANPRQMLYMGYDTNLGTYGSGYIQAEQKGATWTPLLLNPNGGNVGIGTTTPGATLDVNGSLRVGSEQTLILNRTIPTTVDNTVDIGNFATTHAHTVHMSIVVSDGGFSVSKVYDIASGYDQTGGAWKIVQPISDSGVYSGNNFQLEANQSLYILSFRIRRTVGAQPGTAYVTMNYDSTLNGVFTASSATASGVAAVTTFYPSTVLTQVGGNVGIGTTSPTAKLHIAGTGQNTPALTEAGSRDNLLFLDQSANLTTGSGGGALFGANGQRFAAIKGYWWDSTGNSVGDLAFSTRRAVGDSALTEAMRIMYTGYVGIGTTTPDNMLTIAKDQNQSTSMDLRNPNAGSSAATNYFAYNSSYVAGFGLSGTNFSGYGSQLGNMANIYSNAPNGLNLMADNATGFIDFATGGPTERMRIATSGSVYIGTSTTYTGTYKFFVENSTNGVAGFMNDGALGAGGGAGMQGLINALPTAGGQRLGFLTFGTMTTAVKNTASVEGYASDVFTPTSMPTYLTFSTTPANSTARAEVMRIDQNGNVGIGTTSPSNTLTVNGTGQFTGHMAIGNYGIVDTYTGIAGDPVNQQARRNLPSTLLLNDYRSGDLSTAFAQENLSVMGSYKHTGTASTSIYGIDSSPYINSDSTGPFNGLEAVDGYSTNFGSGPISYMMGGDFGTTNYGTGRINYLAGLGSWSTNKGAAIVDANIGFEAGVANEHGTVANSYGVMIDSATNTLGGTTQNNYGLYVNDQSGSGAANTYNIYSAGTGVNYFGGNVGIGTSTPSSILHVRKDLDSDVALTVENQSTGVHHDVQLVLKDAVNTLSLVTQSTSLVQDFIGSSLIHSGVGPLNIKAAVANQPLRLYAGGQDSTSLRMTIDGTDGHVMIGTTTNLNSDSLTVWGNTTGGNHYTRMALNNPTAGSGTSFRYYNGSLIGAAIAYNNDTSQFQIDGLSPSSFTTFGTAGVERMRITNAGDVTMQNSLMIGGTNVSASNNSIAFGHTTDNNSNITASGNGSMAMGYGASFSGAGQIAATGTGAFAGGYTTGGAGTMIVSSINSGGGGSLAFGEAVNWGHILSYGAGSVALGYSAVLGDITSSGIGSFAFGEGMMHPITSSGNGSFAGGDSFNGAITATGDSSFAYGQNINATAQLATAFGSGYTNSTANSFNVGYGATPTIAIDASSVGVNGTLNAFGASRFTTLPNFGPASNNVQVGMWNPLWTAIGAGKSLYDDEDFAVGYNGVNVYNNSGGNGVVINRVASSTAPNTSGYVLQIVDNGNSTSPGYGGFYLPIFARANTTFVERFKAWLPVGYTFVLAENPQGSDSTSYWLTPVAGTGKWEEYIRVSHAGSTGTFSSGGHVWVSSAASNVFSWYLASANIYEVENGVVTTNTLGTAGQVPYYGAAGRSLTATSSLFIASTSNVGIGTVAPRGALETAAGAQGTTNGNATFTGGGAGWVGWYGNTWSNVIGQGAGEAAYHGGDAGGIFNGGAGTYVSGGGAGLYAAGGNGGAYGRGGTGLFVKGGIDGVNYGSGVAPALVVPDNGGNVGIGTNSPGNKLTVMKSVNDTIPALGSNGGSFGIFKSDSGNQLGNYGMIFGVLGTGDVFQQVQRVDSNATAYNLLLQPNGGNVGIGTTSPYAKLSVVGLTVADNFNALNSSATSTFSGGFVANGLSILDNAQLGNMTFDADAGTVSWMDMPFLSAANNTVESYSAQLNGNQALTIWGQEDGAGNLKNLRSLFGTTTTAILSSSNIPFGSVIIGNGALCVQNSGAANNCATAGRTAGTIYAQAASVTALDLAEQYPTTDTTLMPGELLMADPANPIYVSRYNANPSSVSTTGTTSVMSASGTASLVSASGTDPLASTTGTTQVASVSGTSPVTSTVAPVIIGVVSTAPGLVLGGFNGNVEKAAKNVPVALTGRVPVLVNLEGGPIAVGDRLAPSSIPGVATKATKTGYTVGTALESVTSLDGASSVAVTAFIDRVYYVAPVISVVISTTTVSTTTIDEQIAAINTQITSIGTQVSSLASTTMDLASTTSGFTSVATVLASTTNDLQSQTAGINMQITAINLKLANLASTTSNSASTTSGAGFSGGSTSGSTISSTASTTADQQFASINSQITLINSHVSSLASTSADLASTTAYLADAIDALSATSSTFFASTSQALASSTPFIQAIANAVQNLIAVAGNWVVNRLTAHIAYIDRVEAKVAAISEGLEMTDQATGSIYCVAIRNGNWDRVLGPCGTASSTAVVASSTSATNTAAVINTASVANTVIPNLIVTDTSALSSATSSTVSGASVSTTSSTSPSTGAAPATNPTAAVTASSSPSMTTTVSGVSTTIPTTTITDPAANTVSSNPVVSPALAPSSAPASAPDPVVAPVAEPAAPAAAPAAPAPAPVDTSAAAPVAP